MGQKCLPLIAAVSLLKKLLPITLRDAVRQAACHYLQIGYIRKKAITETGGLWVLEVAWTP